ncbi:MAG: glycosyltransferase family 9 protein, partial [Nitrososphaeraceae archaeon]|nr:glycosyltransferase family 9 protein [Nitrososphaeraceae archaeon]
IEKLGKKFLATVTKAAVKNEKRSFSEIIPEKIKNVLIVHQDRKLGNYILTTPLISAASKIFNNAIIDIILPENIKVLADDNPKINTIYSFNHKSFIKNPFSFFSFLKKIRISNYDVAIESSNPGSTSYLNGYITYKSKAKFRIGFSYGNGSLFTNIHVRPDLEKHYYLNQQQLLSSLLQDELIFKPEIYVEKSLVENKRKFIQKNLNLNFENKLIGIWIGARHNKKWDINNFINLYQKIFANKNYDPILLFGIEEINDFKNLAESDYNKLYISGLNDLKITISALDKIICGDTGPLHLSFALGKPTIGIFLQDNYKTYGYAEGVNNFIITPAKADTMIKEILQVIS